MRAKAHSGINGVRKTKAAPEKNDVTASRRRIGNIMRGRGMTSAYARKRFKPHRMRGSMRHGPEISCAISAPAIVDLYVSALVSFGNYHKSAEMR